MKKFCLYLSILCLITAHPKSTRADIDPATGALIGAGILASGVVAWNIYRSFYPNDQTVLDRAQKAHKDAEFLIRNHKNLFALTQADLDLAAAQSYPEPKLNTVPRSLYAILNDLDRAHDDLMHHAHLIAQRFDGMKEGIFKDMTKEQLASLQKASAQIDAQRTFLRDHRQFLACHAAYRSVYKRFGQALKEHNAYGTRANIDAFVYDKINGSGSATFPYLNYTDSITYALSELQSSHEALQHSQENPAHQAGATQVLAGLASLKQTLLSSQKYQEDINKKQHWDVEQQKIAALNEKNRIEKQKADDTARIEQQKAAADLLAAQAKMKAAQAAQEANRIEREKLHYHYQPMPPPRYFA